MKKFSIGIVIALLVVTGAPIQLKAGKEIIPVSLDSTKIVESTEANALLSRLDEINAMDKTSMSLSERKQLRKEVRAIKNELNELGGGVYISVGAIIIILLLLILLL